MRRHAAETALAVIRESGRAVDDTDPIACELVDLAAHYDLPLSTVVAWIRFQPGGTDLSTRRFAEHGQRLRSPHAGRGGGYDAAADPHVLPLAFDAADWRVLGVYQWTVCAAAGGVKPRH